MGGHGHARPPHRIRCAMGGREGAANKYGNAALCPLTALRQRRTMCPMATAPITVVEVAPFPTAAASVWSEEEKAEFIDYIARNPQTGVVIPGTGGVRKVRWTRAGMGKRGGVRVIYFYHSEAMPVFLLTVYAKSERENLTEDQKRTMARIVEAIIAGHSKRGTP